MPKSSPQARKDGYIRARIDGVPVDLESSSIALAKTKSHTIELIVDRLVIRGGDDDDDASAFQSRLVDSVETTLRAGRGVLIAGARTRAKSCVSASSMPAPTAA